MKWTAIIVDDEPLARKLIANLLKSVSEVNILGLYGTGKEAIEAIDNLSPDILFLDIQLKDMTGFEVLKKIQIKMPLIIFTTAFDKYAINAFNIFAFDYLLKPYAEERFYQSIYKGIETLSAESNERFKEKMTDFLNHVKHNEANEVIAKSRIPVPFGGKTVFVTKAEIHYILASNYYIEIYTAQTKYLLRNSMFNMMNELDPNSFIRIHRSSIINLNSVDELMNSAYGEIDVRMQGGLKLRVSKSYRKQFLIKVGVNK